MPNTFNVGDIVKTAPTMATQKAGGTIRYIACGDARASVNTCNKKLCAHANKDYVWVEWVAGSPGLSVFNYLELELMRPASVAVEKPKAEEKPIPVEVKSQINDAIKEFKGKQPIDGKELDFDIYNGFKPAPNRSGNLVYRKRANG